MVSWSCDKHLNCLAYQSLASGQKNSTCLWRLSRLTDVVRDAAWRPAAALDASCPREIARVCMPIGKRCLPSGGVPGNFSFARHQASSHPGRAVSTWERITPDLDTLISLFYEDRQQVGAFREVEAAQMAEPFRKLLAHEHHMTVTVESHHGSPVDVKVLRRDASDSHYAREILLTRQSDGRVVQYGIMRIRLDLLPLAARQEVVSEGTPLGRVLIQHNILRSVHLFSLFEITPGAVLQQWLTAGSVDTVYGRTALIYCNGEPAVELLEIVNG